MSAFAFSKLFSSITKSTVWCEPHTTVRLWITLLADCDSQGRVHASIPGLANLARVTVEECEVGLATFLAPDPYSRTPDNEGRRIEVIDGGWRLLNYELYREKRDPDARREQNRCAQQRSRARQHASAEAMTHADSARESAQAEGRRQKGEESQEQVRSRGSRLPPGWALPDDWRTWAREQRPDLNIEAESEKFADHWRAKAGRDAYKLDWSATWRNWIRNARAEAPRPGAARESVAERVRRLAAEGQRRDAEVDSNREVFP